ncbi:S-ribosylhomocysteine lyase [Paramicrobacterium sp. CJ85]|uniref:S-ribosylhomocysteine lyase n=1 Tax=Paramicrobacterium sp. CJ85 TaxID=3445355 RepID=UPI003F5EBF3D
MEKVESFALDHTAVHAPYVRRITVERGPHGDAISNFDIRLVQPNAGEIPTAGLHTIEHLLAGLLRKQLTGVIDCSPFGCRTGFHLIVWGEPDAATVAAAVKSALTVIADRITWSDVPATDAVSCGNYRDHSLHSAKTWAADVLAQGISSDAFSRELV